MGKQIFWKTPPVFRNSSFVTAALFGVLLFLLLFVFLPVPPASADVTDPNEYLILLFDRVGGLEIGLRSLSHQSTSTHTYGRALFLEVSTQNGVPNPTGELYFIHEDESRELLYELVPDAPRFTFETSGRYEVDIFGETGPAGEREYLTTMSMYWIVEGGPSGTPPTCVMVATPESIVPGESSLLSWTSSDTTSASLNQGFGSVPANSSQSVSPTTTTTYTLSVVGEGGSGTCTTTVTVESIEPADPPTCTLSAAPQNIALGETTILEWTTENADSFSISPDQGNLPVGTASKTISPTATTTFVGTAVGPGGEATCQTTVGVANGEPPISDELSLSLDVAGTGQFKRTGTVAIEHGVTFVGNDFVAKGVTNDNDGGLVKMEVEVKQVNENFDGSNTVISAATISGTLIDVLVEDLIPKDEHYQSGGNIADFKWRARAVGEEGLVSEWIEFEGVNGKDFTAKVVPLVTQNISSYPSDEQTRFWSPRDYAAGVASTTGCGLTIEECGCAISSVVMLGQYHGIRTGINGSSSDPFTMDQWLLANSGYSKESLIWDKALQFLGTNDGGVKKQYLTLKNHNATSESIINASLVSNAPVIAYNNRWGHYFVVDANLGSTYATRDPFWYNTKTTNDTRSLATFVQDYDNVISKANIFSYSATPKVAVQTLLVHLASPAELLVVDSAGNLLGIDPVTGESFSEISEGSYTKEGPIVTSDEPIPADELHEVKVIRITNATDQYYVEVVGTGEGEYTLTTTLIPETGETRRLVEKKTTALNQIDRYLMEYDQTTGELMVEAAPTTLEVFGELRAQVSAIPMTEQLQRKLLRLLRQTETFYSRDRVRNAERKLDAFIAAFERTDAADIDQADAQALIAEAEEIRVLLRL